MIAPTTRMSGQRDVSVVAVPADGPIGKHAPEFVDVGRPVLERALARLAGRGAIVGVHGGVELLDGHLPPAHGPAR